MSLDPTKTDLELGQRIFNYLDSKGVETPVLPTDLSNDEKIKRIKDSFTDIMNTMGLDLKDDSLKDTPSRLAKMYINEIFWGLQPKNFPKITVVANKMGYESMVIEKNIVVQSICEHHFAAIDGFAHLAYIPKDKVLGLSKLNRVVEYFSRRPQIQERLTEQIFYTLEHILETSNIAVLINAKHFCVKSRGVEDINSSTITSKLGGSFKEHVQTRNEFMHLIHTL